MPYVFNLTKIKALRVKQISRFPKIEQTAPCFPLLLHAEITEEFSVSN